MSRQQKASKHLGKSEARYHTKHHKHERYDSHKLAVAMGHNKYEREHNGEATPVSGK